ncbi:MAG: HEAT repeat domain-containing protein [Deltaproteobacteria bacterium]|nr:HEAT repeat domain-containing protein [Deltaproteobacteria bacterium]
MTDSEIQEKAIEALVIMNTAIINLRLYPPTNAMIVKTIDRLHDTLLAISEEIDALIFAESDRNLLVSGEPLSQKYLEKPQVAIFLMLMINWGIKSITFNKGLDKSELTSFLEIMGKKPDDVKKEKGMEQLISEGKMPHIQINQKFYVSTDQDHQIVARMDIKDEDIIEYMTSEDPSSVLDPEKLKEIAKDPEWISRIFQSGMRHLVDKDGAASPIALSESMLHMLRTLDEISEHADKERISQLAAKSISDMDADLIATIITRNMEGLLENRLFDQIVGLIDHEKFKQVAGKLHQAFDDASMEGKGPDSEKIESAQQAYQHLMNTDKGVELQHQIQEKQAREKEERKNKIREIKEKVHDFFNKLEGGIPDESAAKSLPEMVDTLFSEGETEMAETIIDRLTGNLLGDNPGIRTGASESLAKILVSLSGKRQTDILTGHSDKLLTWIKSETVLTDAFKTICTQLKDLAQSRIQNHRFVDSLPILEAFWDISSRPLDEDGGIPSVASDTLREAATADILEILLEEFRTDKTNQRKDAGRNLVMMAGYSISRLLDILRDSEDSSERVLFLNLIPEIGHAAAPAVIERIEESASWYYLRNLARLLGRVGGEEHAIILAPLLVYDDPRVQREALKSVNTIGGTRKGEILLNALSQCDDHLKAGIVTALGSLKHRDAVKPLMEMFKSKSTLSADMKIDLQEKICLALGSIGDKEALPFLTEVSKQSGLFGLKAHPPKVKAAAGKAVDMITRKG